MDQWISGRPSDGGTCGSSSSRAPRGVWGKPLLMAYLFLALFGIVVVAVCIVIMHL